MGCAAVNDFMNFTYAVDSGLMLNDGRWHHAAGVWGLDVMAIYVDGALAGTAPGGGDTSIADTTLPLRVGTDSSGLSDSYFNGLIDDVRVWNSERSAVEIQAGMNAGVDPTTSNLVGYWDFDDGGATDLTTNGADGTLAGGAASQLIPVAQFDAVSLALGTVDVGSTTPSSAFTITNTGDIDMTLTGVSSLDPSRFTASDPGTLTIAPGAGSGPISVTFTADRAGGEFSALDVLHDGRGVPTVPVSGVGRLTVVATGDITTTQIAFTRGGEVGKDIWLMDADGANEVLILGDSTDDWNPAWSPDGTQIAYQTDGDSSQDIYVMNADGTSPVNLTDNPFGNDGTPNWSPDGSKIVFMSQRDSSRQIYVMNADGSAQTRVLTSANEDRRPVWSPDGQKIAFFSTGPGIDVRQLSVMNADGSGLHALSDGTQWFEYPRWSPDGSQIAFSGDDGTGWQDIWVMNADGSNMDNVTMTPSDDEWEPFWSPDGSQIVFQKTGATTNLAVMDADGGNVTPLGSTTGDVNPAWAPFIEPPLEGEQAVAFDGVDDYIEVADSPSLQTSSFMTIEAWFKTTQAVGDFTTLAGKWQTDGTDASYKLGWTTASGLGFSVDVAGVKTTASSGLQLNDGLWHHVAGVWVVGAGSVYVDGELAGTDVSPVNRSTSPANIG
jgi:Tol biopolymer transport system component